MAKKRKRPVPSQAEIWDDTALVRSWNEAVEEYEVCTFSFFSPDAAKAKNSGAWMLELDSDDCLWYHSSITVSLHGGRILRRC